MIGRKFDDKEVQKTYYHAGTRLLKGTGVAVEMGDMNTRQVKFQLMTWGKIKARRSLGEQTEAVITVPAYFDDSQRQATGRRWW